MVTRTIPVLPGVPLQSLEVELDGSTYRLELAWNERDEAWSLSIFAQDGTQLLAGRAVLLGAGLTIRSVDRRLPPGELLVVDTSGRDEDAGLADLGDRVLLVYREAAP